MLRKCYHGPYYVEYYKSACLLPDHGRSTLGNTGQVSAILLPPDQLSANDKRNAVEVDQGEFRDIFELAEKEYKRLESSPKEFYLVLANPPSIVLPEVEVDRLMQILGSSKEINGSWLPVIVRALRKNYFKVWGKTAYCG